MSQANCAMVQKQMLYPTVFLRNREEKLDWAKKLQLFSKKDEKLLWNDKQVTTVDEFDSVVRPIHINQNGDPCTLVRKLRDAVQSHKYNLPHFLSGFERDCFM